MLDKLFRPRPADGMVLVLGLGRFGIACARRLQELGMDVLGRLQWRQADGELIFDLRGD